jgi:uncharacterized repeat protein (TIGR03809 family)
MAGHGLLPKGENIGRRFQSLAEKRRRHLLELYRSGRWRHYFTEDQLASEVHAASRLIDSWKQYAEEQGEPPHVEAGGIAPEPPDASIQREVTPGEAGAASSDRPVTLLHD